MSYDADYERACACAAIAAPDDVKWQQFRQLPAIQRVIEHVSIDDGFRYLQELLHEREHDETLELLDRFRSVDAVGDPVICHFGAAGFFDPLTLRYVKIAMDLMQQFQPKDDMHVLELGGGFGGLCLTLQHACSNVHYHFVELPSVLKLAKRFLQANKVNTKDKVQLYAYSRSKDDADMKRLQDVVQRIDVVVSNHAWSEFAAVDREWYLQHVLRHIKNGYMILNYLSHEQQDAVAQRLPGSMLMPEVPQTHPNNRILLWKPKIA